MFFSQMYKREVKDKHSLVQLKEADARKIINSMRKDVAFLKSQNLMDYSMLVVIEKVEENRQ